MFLRWNSRSIQTVNNFLGKTKRSIGARAVKSKLASISTTSYKILTANVAAVYQVIELIKNNDGIPQRMMCELVMDRYI